MTLTPSIHLWVALLLASCGSDTPARPCERLGLLCGEQDRVQSLDLTRSKGVSGDLDGDGHRELVSASESGLSIAWKQPEQRDYQLVPGGVPDAELGDIDGDGDLDVVFVTAEPATLRVLENRGPRQFADGPTLALAGRAQSLWLGRLDDDDSIDAVVASGGEGTLTVITGGLTRARPIMVGRDLIAVEVGDLGGDGHLDIVAADRGDAAIHIVLAKGADFAAPRRVATGLEPAYLQLYDLDGDDRLDVLTHGKGAEIWFHQGDGVGGFAPARGLVAQTGASQGFGVHRDEQGRRWLITLDDAHPIASQLDDLDQVVRRAVAGGILDADGLDMDDGSPLVHGSWLGERHSLAASHVFTELWHGGEPSLQAIALGDVDLDGELDLVTVDGDVTVRRHLPDGTWGEPWMLAMTDYVVSIAVADVTGDGLPDLVIGDSAPSVFVAIGAGDGTFTPGPVTPIEDSPRTLYAGLAAPGEAAAVATAGYNAPGVTVRRFASDGALKDESTPLPYASARTLTSADLDDDGDMDLVVLDGGDTSLVIVPRDGDGWDPPHTRSLADLHLKELPDEPLQNPRLVLGDLDSDGRVDGVLVASSAIVRLMDIGADAPPPPQLDELLGLSYPDALALADIDDDGLLDLVTCTSGELQIVLMAPGTAPRPQEIHDQFIHACALHVEPDAIGITAATATDRGYSVLRPDFAPALARTDLFPGGPSPLRRLVTGDIDADGLTDFVVSDDGSGATSSTAVFWGHRDGTPRRATWQDGILFSRTELAVAPLDDTPGDDIVIASASNTQIWAHTNSTLQLISTASQTSVDSVAVGVQGRAGERSDVVLLGRIAGHKLGLVALPRGEDGGFIADGEVLLWSGPSIDGEPSLTIADFDGDGFDDIAVRPGIPQAVVLVWGHRERTPQVTQVHIPLPEVASIMAADLDGGGIPALIAGTGFGVARIGFSGRVPTEPEVLTQSPAQQGLLVTDLEGDGHADLLRVADDQLHITLRSAGDDAYVQLDFAAPWSLMRAVDLDGDQIQDLVGIRDGGLSIRLSGPSEVPSP